MKTTSVLLLTSTLALPPWAEAASQPDGDNWTPSAFERRITLGVPLALFLGDVVRTAFAPEAEVYLPVSPRFAVSARFGASVVTAEGTEAGITNPSIALFYWWRTRSTRLRAGVGLSAPLAPEDQLTSVVSIAPRGFWDAWNGAPGVPAIFFPLRLEHRGKKAAVAFEGALAFFLPNEGRDVETALQLATELYAPLETLEVGVRLQSALLLVSFPGQVAVSPFVRARVSGNVRVALAPYVFLNTPLGPVKSVVGVDARLSFVF